MLTKSENISRVNIRYQSVFLFRFSCSLNLICNSNKSSLYLNIKDCQSEWWWNIGVCYLARTHRYIRLGTLEGSILRLDACLSWLMYCLCCSTFACWLSVCCEWCTHTLGCITVHTVIKLNPIFKIWSQQHPWECRLQRCYDFNWIENFIWKTHRQIRDLLTYDCVCSYTNSQNWISCVKLDTKTSFHLLDPAQPYKTHAEDRDTLDPL